MLDKIKKTKDSYGFLWDKVNGKAPIQENHFNEIQNLVKEPIVKGRLGVDIGSGCGFDTYIMASKNPLVKIVSLEISDGIYKTKEITSRLKNLCLIKGSVLELPLKDNSLDFAYSFGVLHHIPDPVKGLKEISRVLKEGASVYLYLYEDHSKNPVKQRAIKAISILRKITTRMSPKALYIISFMVSPFAMFIFSYPAMIFRKFKLTKPLADKMPFNFGTHLFSLTGDIYDRFSAPIEYRYNRKQVYDLLSESNFRNISIERIQTKAGWVAWGYKTNA